MPRSDLHEVAIYIGVCTTVAVIFIVAGLLGALKKFGAREIKQKLVDCLRPIWASVKTVLTNRMSVYTSKRDWSKPDTHWSNARLAKEICDDLLQNFFLVACAIISVCFAIKLGGEHNPLVVNNEVGESVSPDMLVKDGLESLGEKLTLLSNLLVAIISVMTFGIVAVWCFTKIGDKAGWMKVRMIFHLKIVILSVQGDPSAGEPGLG